VILGDETVDVVALRMLLSHSRGQAIVRARSKTWLGRFSCHLACGGAPPTVRLDHEKTAIWKGAGARGTI